MHPVYHVLVSILIGLGIGLHVKNRVMVVVAIAVVVNGLIDFDAILFREGLLSMRIFHTAIVLVYIPILILLASYLYERKKRTSIWTRISMVVVIVSFSHLLMDTFFPADRVYLYYPFSTHVYQMDPSLVPHAIIVFILVVVGVNFLETGIYMRNEGDVKVRIKNGGGRILAHYRERLMSIWDKDI